MSCYGACRAMKMIKNLKQARKKILEISNRFDLSKRQKELKVVEDILSNVKTNGDKALKAYTKKFDKVTLKSIKIAQTLIDDSINDISKDLLGAIKHSINRITSFQKINISKSWIKVFKTKEKLGYKYVPLDSVGIYIPGGTIPLVSTVLMTVIPAKVAGVKRIALFTPPPVHRAILTACKLLGISEVYQIGGAQAIAAAAYGTESVAQVNKIVGPGNIYVTLAKKNVFGKVGIDGLYGPSEIAIVADNTANSEHLAIDLLSQLEHGSGLESAVLVTNSDRIASETERCLLKRAGDLPNKERVLQSWKNNSAIILVKNINEAIELINELAPEHLEIITKDAWVLSKKIKNAGAIFIGEYSCESIGDYIAGPSHCLPTGGCAKFASGLTVMDFMKKISIVSFNKRAFDKVANDVIRLANVEGLKAHGDAIKLRINKKVLLPS